MGSGEQPACPRIGRPQRLLPFRPLRPAETAGTGIDLELLKTYIVRGSLELWPRMRVPIQARVSSTAHLYLSRKAERPLSSQWVLFTMNRSSQEPLRSAETTRSTLAAHFDAFAANVYGIDGLRNALVLACERDREASWQVLALLDQYQRRGVLDLESAKNLKRHISRLAFGLPNAATGSEDSTPGTPTQQAAVPFVPEPAPTLIREPAVVSAGTRPTSAPAVTNGSAATLSVGRALNGRYVLEELLWERNGLRFFKALDLHRKGFAGDARYVGIKSLQAGSSSQPARLEALQQEFRQMQSLLHPSIPRVFDLDRDGEMHFITMEWLPGINLSELLLQLNERVLAREHAVTLIHCIGSALAHAHERGVVHGELRAEQVTITQSGDVKLHAFALNFADWRQLPGDWDTGAIITTGVASGPADQELSGVIAWDEHSDIFSLACLSYQLLTGRHPFDGMTAAQARDKRRTPAQVAGLTGEQWRALRHALAWNRARRTHRVREFLRELGAERSADRLPPPAVLFAAATTRRRLRPLAVGAFVVCVGVLALAVFVVMNPGGVPGGTLLGSQRAADRRQAPISTLNSVAPVTSGSPAPLASAEPHNQRSSPAQPPLNTASQPDRTSEAQVPVRPADFNRNESKLPESPKVSAAAPEAESLPVAKSTAAEGMPGVLSFAQDTYTVAPEEGIARLNLKRRGGSKGAISFKWWTVAGSAQPDKDFVAVPPRTEQMAAGQEQIVLFVPVVADTARKGTEYFEVHIDDPEGGARLGDNTQATVILVGAD